MNLDDLKDQFVSTVKFRWEQFQDSSVYNQLKDRYENMSPPMQKATLIGSAVVVALMILSIPQSYYTQSQEYVLDFESKRDTIRELLKVSRESSDVPNIPEAPAPGVLKTQLEGYLGQANLLPEQIAAIQVAPASSQLIPGQMSQGAVTVILAKLNLRQIVDIGHYLQALNPSVKMSDLQIIANREDGNYFDATYKLVSLAVPAAPEAPAEEPPRRGRRGNDE